MASDVGAMMLLSGLVVVVLLAGAAITTDGTPTARVVQEAGEDCSACSGTPVCAQKGSWVETYDNACAARCAEARIVSDGACDRLP